MTIFVRAFGWDKIYGPGEETNAQIYKEAAGHLLSRFRPGIYLQKQDINSILQHQFTFYAERTKRLVKKLASRDFLEFVLYQYDLSTILRESGLSEDEQSVWHEMGASFRRGLKYLAEHTVLRAPPESTVMSLGNLRPTVEEAFLCAMEMAKVYQFSDITHGLLPEHSKLEVFPARSDQIYSIEGTSPYEDIFPSFLRRVARHNQYQSEFLPRLTIDLDPKAQAEVLDPFFQASLGLPFSDFCAGLSHVIMDPKPEPGRYPIPFCHFDRVLEALAESGRPEMALRKMVSGFTLFRSALVNQGREIWNIKQTHRAFRRPFFEFPHKAGAHLMWSKSMAQESFLTMLNGMPFKKLPSEWQTPKVMEGMDELSNKVGRWFESEAQSQLSKVDIAGQPYKAHIPISGGLLQIPPAIGEIDLLGAIRHSNTIVLAEFKMVQGATEPKLYRDDISQFLKNSGAFAPRFRKKIAWVWEQRELLAKKYGLDTAKVRLAPVLVTMYPTFAASFIQDFPCVSLVELLLDYRSSGTWPYAFWVPSDK